MKNFQKLTTNVLPMASMLLLALFLFSCGGGQRQVQEDRLQEVKEDTELQLRQLKNEIDDRIEDLDGEIEEAEGELEEELKEIREELKVQRESIAAEMEKVEAATLETWEEVIGEVTRAYEESRGKTVELMQQAADKLQE